MRGLSRYINNVWDLVLERNRDNFSRPTKAQILEIRKLTTLYLYTAATKQEYLKAGLYLEILCLLEKPIESWTKLETEIERILKG